MYACKQMHAHTTDTHTQCTNICMHTRAQKCTHTCEHIRILWSYVCTSITSSGSSLKIIQWLKLKGLVLKNGHTRELLYPLWLFKRPTLITTAAYPMLTMVSLFIFNSQWVSEGLLFLNSTYSWEIWYTKIIKVTPCFRILMILETEFILRKSGSCCAPDYNHAKSTKPSSLWHQLELLG